MKKPSMYLLITLVLSVAAGSEAQSSKSIESMTRPRVVAASKTSRSSKTKFQEPSTQPQTPSRPAETETRATEKATTPNRQQPEESKSAAREDSRAGRLSPQRIRLRISEAERLMKVRPVPTAMVTPSLDYVTVAALLPETSQIHLIRISKQAFLTKGSEVSATTSLGLPVSVRIVRANGVNTAVTAFDDKNRSLLPLVVEFPIERKGVFREMAYYTSAHPALLSPELMKSGQTYVNSMMDLAAKRLHERGVNIAPSLIEVAKRLCIVEHVDHERFRNENRIALFEEIYTLYALNLLDGLFLRGSRSGRRLRRYGYAQSRERGCKVVLSRRRFLRANMCDHENGAGAGQRDDEKSENVQFHCLLR